MKRIFLILMVALFASCSTAEEKNNEEQMLGENKIESVIVKDEAGKSKDLVLTKDEYLSLYRLAQKYVALREKINNATVKENVNVKKISESEYEVSIKLDDKITLISIIEINEAELKELREKVRKYTEEEPQVQVKYKKKNIYEITMSIDDVKWTAEIDLIAEKGFDINSFWGGVIAGIFIGALF